MDRRGFIRTISVLGGFTMAGCNKLENNTPEIPLEMLRVVNLYDSKVEIKIEVETGDNATYFSKAVRPISEGPGKEWIVRPEITDALDRTYALQIESGTETTLTSDKLRRIYSDSPAQNPDCLYVNWLVQNPNDRIGLNAEFRECDSI